MRSDIKSYLIFIFLGIGLFGWIKKEWLAAPEPQLQVIYWPQGGKEPQYFSIMDSTQITFLNSCVSFEDKKKGRLVFCDNFKIISGKQTKKESRIGNKMPELIPDYMKNNASNDSLHLENMIQN